jgi:beta-galactosidase
MFFRLKAFIFIIVALLLCDFQVQARTSLYDAPFNMNWKFYKGDPTGTPQNLTYNDASWTTVSVPHSASYDKPTVAGEQNFYGNPSAPNKNYWYRKKFICPVSARKVFIYFGGIMQTATVYVNGIQVGAHLNTGYTGFYFDISNNVVRGDTTCIAIRANINNDHNIPPGGSGSSETQWANPHNSAPDYLLYSGMYRDVLLLFKDSVYVPLRGQRTATTGSTAAPTVHAVTYVRNDAPAAKTVTVTMMVLDATGNSVATQTASQSTAANSTTTFDMTTGAVSTPHLWSPSSPYLYSLHTRVMVNGTVKDSVVEPIGLRFYSWSAGTPGGLSINGTLTEIKGMCLGQWIGWMENAVPDSRFGKIVGMIKDMGANGIRCSHYPRADAFYHACDSVGMLVLVECPNWGTWGGFAGLTTFWTNMYKADSEMVLDAYNHPSIWGWSLFNEPTENNLQNQFANENNVVHGIEAVAPNGRVTLISNFGGLLIYGLDIFGANYNTSPSTSLPIVCTEYYGNFDRNFARGNDSDLAVDANSEANSESSAMMNAWSTTDKCGGAHFWCFMDYCSYEQLWGREGLVDRLYLPKNVYFMFRNKLRGIAPDYWTNGTPTHVELIADLANLKANGSDISQIVATLRDANGACKHQACNVTFTVSSGASSVAMLYTGESVNPASGASTVACAVEGGRAGIFLRTSTIPGNIVVTATTSCGLSATTVNLTSTAADETLPTLVWDGTSVNSGSQPGFNDVLRLKTVYTGKGIMISFPKGTEKTVRIMNSQGRILASYTLKNGIPVLVDHRVVASGILYAVWDDADRRIRVRLNNVR